MQGKTAAPREDLTTAQVDERLTGNGVTRGFGMELLDQANMVIEDLSADCSGFTVSHDNNAEVHGQVRATLARELAWGTARIRPYRTLSKGGVTARFDRGVFVLTTPDTNRGRLPVTYAVTGQDLTQRLTREVGDTHVVLAGTTYIAALRDVLTASGVGGTALLDGSSQDTTLPEDRVWALTAGPRWLDIANDLMAEIAYVDVFTDERGVFRSQPTADSDSRPVEHRFDTGDEFTDLVAADRSETYDVWAAPNTWRFVRNRLGYQPFTGDGIYEVANTSDGQSSVDSMGVVSVTHFLDVADQAALVAEGDRIVAADRRAERRFTLSVDPFPIAGHRDVVELVDSGRTFKVQVASWEEPTSGRGTWVLGGGPGGAAAAHSEQQATATVTQATAHVNGLRVVVDGATVDSPAFALADDSAVVPSYEIGSRVTCTVRNPTPPLVQGTETS